MADIDARLKQRLGRITFRAWREHLLSEDDDHRLYAWIIGTEPTPEVHETQVMAKIRVFMRDHVAAAVAEGAG